MSITNFRVYVIVTLQSAVTYPPTVCLKCKMTLSSKSDRKCSKLRCCFLLIENMSISGCILMHLECQWIDHRCQVYGSVYHILVCTASSYSTVWYHTARTESLRWIMTFSSEVFRNLLTVKLLFLVIKELRHMTVSTCIHMMHHEC